MQKYLFLITAILTFAGANATDFLTEYGETAAKASAPRFEAPAKAAEKATLPYYHTFDSQESLGELTLLTNYTSKQWKWLAGCPTFNEACAKVETNYWGGLKAYIVLPAMELKAGKYTFEFEAWGQSDFNPEFITAAYAPDNSLDAITGGTVIVEPQQLQGYCYTPNSIGTQEKQKFSREVEIAEPGTYYFAVGTAKDGSGLAVYVDNIALTAVASATSPGSLIDFSVQPDMAGALSATVSAKAPTTDIEGQPLAELSGVKIYRGTDLVATATPDADGNISFTDTPATPGNYLYRAAAFNSGGDGETSAVQTYVGHAAPAAPANFYAYHGATCKDVIVEWDTPLDIYGKTFAPNEITYTLKVTRPGNIDWFDPLVSDLSGNSYDFTMDVEDDQTFVRFSFIAKNEYGQESAVSFPAARIPIGKPYTAPFAESFTDGGLSYLFRTKMEGEFGLWGLTDDETYAGTGISSQDGDNGFMVYAGMADGDAAGLYTGIVDLSTIQNPALSFYYFGQDTNNELQVWIKAEKEFVPLAEPIVMSLGLENEWNHVIYSLMPYADKNIELGFRATSREAGMIALDNIHIFSQRGHDLAVSLSTEPKVLVGDVINLRATVANMGALTAEGYSVDFYCGNDKIATVAGESIESAATSTVECNYIATVAAGERRYTFRAQLNYATDEDASNNVSGEVSVLAVKSVHPAPQNLTATLDGTDAKLTWDAPDLSKPVVLPSVESFEGVAAWAVEEAGGWTFTDADKGLSGYFTDFDLPAITGGQPASWFVLDGSDENCSYYGLTAHSGYQCLAVLYNADGSANNDWAISPLLSGRAQTISFYARSYSNSYRDSFEVLYSTGTTDTKDFKAIAGARYNEIPAMWTEYVVALPEGAKYFAIRYVSTDAFCLLVDDINFAAADGIKANYHVGGYNVYHNGIKATETAVSGTSHTISNIDPDAVNEFHVTAMYINYGESSASNIATLATDGVADITADCTSAEYFNLQGIPVVAPTAPGIYIVRHGATITKAYIK